jgi:thiamine-phosphate pyrophosphorylase
VLLDGGNSLDAFASLIQALIEAGVHALQLRDKRLQDRELLERGRRMRALTRGTSTLFIMNDRPDLARLAQADGVHLGQEEMSVADARAVLGTDRLVGVSTHSLEQARQAVLDGADYIGCGPTFPSETKKFDHFPGLDLLREVAVEITLPAFAIGGITSANLAAVLETGFTRVAVAGAVTQAVNPADAARQLLEILD